MLNLQELLSKINVFTNIKEEVKGITIDSRKIKKGYIFVALKGVHNDGYNFIDQALENGAICIICERDFKTKVDSGFEKIITKDVYNLALKIALILYDNPSKKLKIVGITGTNGKTTTTYILESIFRKAGYKTGIIGTIQNKIGDKIISSENTTPFPTELQRLLFEMVEAKVDYVFMEVSSHALELGRVKGCEFCAAVFTNLTKEHLDFHITMHNYANAKKKLFDMLSSRGFAIVNQDDKHNEKMTESTKAKIIAYSRKSLADIVAKNIKFDRKTFLNHFTIYDNRNLKNKKTFDVISNLIGLHNVENILAGISVALSQNISPEIIVSGIKDLENVKGRFEFIREGQNFACIVDYAHTDDALSRILRTCKSLKMNRIITIFGCGGNRDRKKRPLMAKASAKYSDFVIVTTDNPRDESPKNIFTDIEVGFNEIGFSNYEIIEDREKAIERALNMAMNMDLILIAGKGHEEYQIVGREIIKFSDKEVAKNKIFDILSKNKKMELF